MPARTLKLGNPAWRPPVDAYDPAREEWRHRRPNCRHADHVPCAQPPRHADAARYGSDTVCVAAHTDPEHMDALAPVVAKIIQVERRFAAGRSERVPALQHASDSDIHSTKCLEVLPEGIFPLRLPCCHRYVLPPRTWTHPGTKEDN